MMKIIVKIVLLVLCFSHFLSAHATIDAYGVDDLTAKKIINHCSKNIKKYVEMESQRAFISPDKLDDAIAKHMNFHDRIINEIRKYGDFSFIDLSVVYYPAQNKRYTTIDLVPSSQISRLPQFPKRVINNNLTLNAELKKLFELWSLYNKNNINLLEKGNFNSKKRTCPVVHCVWGFDKNEITQFLPKFKTLATIYNKQLMDIISFSANDEQRGDAIFILAHSEDYHSTASFLWNYTDDKSELVRNNSMRVIGGILSTHKLNNVPLKKIIKALNYPLVTDRDKASYVLYDIARNDRTTHKQIKTEAGNTLINLLKLKQPNNHDNAYRILKVISNKNYVDSDIKNWQNWINSNS